MPEYITKCELMARTCLMLFGRYQFRASVILHFAAGIRLRCLILYLPESASDISKPVARTRPTYWRVSVPRALSRARALNLATLGQFAAVSLVCWIDIGSVSTCYVYSIENYIYVYKTSFYVLVIIFAT